MDNTKHFPTETLQQLCEQAGAETDSDRLQQLARKIVRKLSDRRYQKFDDPTTDDSETAA